MNEKKDTSVFIINDNEYDITQRALEFLHGYMVTEGPAPGVSKDYHWKMMEDIKDLMEKLQSQKKWNNYVNEQFNEVNDDG